MHPYSTDSKERKIVPLCLAIVSILLAWLFNSLLGGLKIDLPWWIGPPGVFGLYVLFYDLFDKFLWKIFRKINVIKVPDLNGTWKGYVTSSFNEHAAKHEANMKISQQWSEISIALDTGNSRSHSLSAAIITKGPSSPVLTYEYLNEPKANAKATMHTHRGTARLTIDVSSNSLEGEYYTGRDRTNFGTLKFQR